MAGRSVAMPKNLGDAVRPTTYQVEEDEEEDQEEETREGRKGDGKLYDHLFNVLGSGSGSGFCSLVMPEMAGSAVAMPKNWGDAVRPSAYQVEEGKVEDQDVEAREDPNRDGNLYYYLFKVLGSDSGSGFCFVVIF